MDPEILYEDNHLLAVNKPAGIPTQPSPTDPTSLETLLKAFIKQRDHKPGNVFLHALHRLDKPASGIVLFAKTQKCLSRVSALLRTKSYVKTYTALIEGKKPPNVTLVTHYLSHGEHRAEICTPDDENAKKAELRITQVRPLQQNVWEVTIDLLTGRYHQIRAQLSALGFPIIGDTKYGSQKPFGKNAIALHHTELSFQHPVKGMAIVVHCEPGWRKEVPLLH